MNSDSARNQILGAIKTSLKSHQQDEQRRNAVNNRLSKHQANLIPERATSENVDLIALMAHYLRGQQANIVNIESAEQLPAAISDYLRSKNLPSRIRCGNDPYWNSVPWSNSPSLERIPGPAENKDKVSLSRAFGASAETGTLFLVSGEANPTTNNFLPEAHIVVISESDVHGPYEDIWTKLREIGNSTGIPRTINLISGPSRTADIEQTITLGAHGPGQLCVIIVGD